MTRGGVPEAEFEVHKQGSVDPHHEELLERSAEWQVLVSVLHVVSGYEGVSAASADDGYHVWELIELERYRILEGFWHRIVNTEILRMATVGYYSEPE